MIDTSKYIHKLDLLNKWLRIQIEFKATRMKLAESGIEFMGDLSQFWSFETWYKVRIGEIKLHA